MYALFSGWVTGKLKCLVLLDKPQPHQRISFLSSATLRFGGREFITEGLLVLLNRELVLGCRHLAEFLAFIHNQFAKDMEHRFGFTCEFLPGCGQP